MGNLFSKNLKYLRESKGISRNKLGEMVGVNQTTIGRWETNEITPSIDNVEEVASVLNIPLPDLLIKDLTNPENSYNKLDNLLFSKAKTLTDDEKQAVLHVIDAIHKDIDKELDK